MITFTFTLGGGQCGWGGGGQCGSGVKSVFGLSIGGVVGGTSDDLVVD